MKEIVNWGVLGNSGIARKHVIPAILNAPHAKFAAIASRSPIEENYGNTKRYQSYEALLDDPEIDAIYVPLPNALHCTWSLKAMEKKKHVLCEKPIALNVEECRRMIEASKEHEVLLMEAFMYRFTAKTKLLMKLVQEGKIGLVRHMRVHFGYKKGFESAVRDKKELGGGALYDIGCYCVDIMNWLMRLQGASMVTCWGLKNMADRAVDQAASAVIQYSNGVLGSMDCWFHVASHQSIMLMGDKGILIANEGFRGTPDAFECITQAGTQRIPVQGSDAYTLEIEAFSEAILTGDTSNLLPLTDSLANMQVLDVIINNRTNKGERT